MSRMSRSHQVKFAYIEYVKSVFKATFYSTQKDLAEALGLILNLKLKIDRVNNFPRIFSISQSK